MFDNLLKFKLSISALHPRHIMEYDISRYIVVSCITAILIVFIHGFIKPVSGEAAELGGSAVNYRGRIDKPIEIILPPVSLDREYSCKFIEDGGLKFVCGGSFAVAGSTDSAKSETTYERKNSNDNIFSQNHDVVDCVIDRIMNNILLYCAIWVLTALVMHVAWYKIDDYIKGRRLKKQRKELNEKYGYNFKI